MAVMAASTFACALSPAHSLGRVLPATLPLPLPGAVPLAPDRLRAHNPWNLPMTGRWRFQLTHGAIVDGSFEPAQANIWGVTASSTQSGHPATDAFDGDPKTRWCADGGSYPQWIQADLRQTQHVTSVSLVWERPAGHYRFAIEGSEDGKRWTMLADRTADPGSGDGPVAITPADVRYVRLTIVGNASGWASLNEIAIHLVEGGTDKVWHPTQQPIDRTQIDDFARPSFDDSRWNTISLPSNWEVLGYSLPTYNAVDDTVGLYRRWVDVPEAFADRRIYWRFDGAMDGAEVFVNGVRAGYHESGFTAFDVDVTGLVRPGTRNLFAVRLSKSTPSSDCETGDFQCLGGIYRETSLICVPQTHVQDITVTTPLTANYQDATLQANVVVAGVPGKAVALTGSLCDQAGKSVTVSLSGQGVIGPDGTATIPLSAFVRSPRLWSAEKPNLYYLMLQLSLAGRPAERIEQRFGFRQVEIKDNVVLWNGRPIKCEGVCRHDYWADKGFALTDREWKQDLTMMKAANVNAIRTSHYNHAARFLELCEEKGFYILDEVPFCWINEKNNDPAFAPALLNRAADTLGRDKNRPCVLAWSIGNENGVGKNSQTVIDFVKKADPTRPAFVSQGGYWGPKGQSFQDMHYPTPRDVDNYLKNDSNKLPAQFSEQPHIFWQKEAQDYDPGVSDLWSEALSRIWDKVWNAPTIAGSYVWEWQNQGIADRNPDRTRDFWYGPDHLRQENNKGIVSAFRVPKPEYWILKMVYSPVAIGARTVSPAGGYCEVPLTNRHSFTDLTELTCRWTALSGKKVLDRGAMHIAGAPGKSCTARFPAPAGMSALHIEFERADGASVTMADLPVAGAPAPQAPAGLTGGDALAVADSAGVLTISNILQTITFDKRTGSLRSWRAGGKDVLTGNAVLNLGQLRTGNERGYYQGPPSIEDAKVDATPQPDGSIRVSVEGVVTRPTGSDRLGMLTCAIDIRRNAQIDFHWSLAWSGAAMRLWEAGWMLPMPSANTHMSWSRDADFLAYSAGSLGEPTGRCTSGETLFRASKRNLHWMTLTARGGTGVVLAEDGTSLIGHAIPGVAGTTTLLASSALAGPNDLSHAWVADHDIEVAPGKTLSGAFTLKAIAGAK